MIWNLVNRLDKYIGKVTKIKYCNPNKLSVRQITILKTQTKYMQEGVPGDLYE